MWYFAWILGVSMAVLLAIVNAMVCDAREWQDADKGKPPGK